MQYCLVLTSSPISQSTTSVSTVLIESSDEKKVKITGDTLKSKLGVKNEAVNVCVGAESGLGCRKMSEATLWRNFLVGQSFTLDCAWIRDENKFIE